MGDGTEPFAMEDADWQCFCEAASREIAADIDAALIRCAKGESTLADAVLLAGYLNRGRLFDKQVSDRQTIGTYLRANFMEGQDE